MASRAAAVAKVAMEGNTKLRRMERSDEERHASSGPRPISASRPRPIGTAMRLYQGAPTVTLLPCTYSLSTGKSVPHRMVKQAARKMRLLNRKLDSRETSDSILWSDLR